MRPVSSKIEVNGFGLDKNVATRLLAEAGLKPTKANIAALVDAAKDSSPKNQYLNAKELGAAVGRLVSERKPNVNPDLPIDRVISSPPPSLSRYQFYLADTDGNSRNDYLSIDPLPLSQRKSAMPQLRATASAPKSRSVNEEIGHTRRGGITLQFKSDGELLDFNKGKWVTSSFAEMMAGRPDREDSIARLKAQGYNINAPRDFLAVSVKGHKEPFLFALRGESDKKAPKADGDDGAGRSRMMPSFNTDKRDYGFVSICTEVQIEGFGDASLITVKKPVIYLYPEKKTQVKVEVVIQGEFAAQYPSTTKGAWNMIATPDGTLFDPKTEKRYSYLFWEAMNPGTMEIDETQAFCVKASEAETFLENAATKFALNDKERTDFVSYWIPALLKNPLSLVQFLDAKTYSTYAQMKIEPQPDTEIRLFMLFKRIPKMVKTGNPSLPELRRGKFTVVEWGGANLDE